MNETDRYISKFPPGIQDQLQQLRAAILRAAPMAEEVISYRMPAFRFNGILVYFAVHQYHIGFYPTASGIENFRDEVAAYKHAKGSVQFPFDQPIPVELVERIVRFRVLENSPDENSI